MRAAAAFTLAAALALCAAPTARPDAAAAAPATDPRLALPATDDGLPGAGPIRHFDWFERLWNQRRTEWASQVGSDQGAVVFLGDSITQGWWDLAGVFPGMKLANRGISGDTTRGVLVRMKDDVLALHPRGVVLLIGTNDIEVKADPEVISGNMKLILASLREADPAVPVILCEVFPSSASKARPAETIRRLNGLYLEDAAADPQVTVLDTYALFRNVHGDAKEEEMPDLLHPNALGYAKWALALRPVMEDEGLLPAWPEQSTVEPGYQALFDGRDLAGWGYEGHVMTGGRTSSDADNRFVARNGRIVLPAPSQGEGTARLVSTRILSRDFTLRFEFRAGPGASAAVLVRDVPLECRNYTSEGPFATLAGFHPLDWNQVAVTVHGAVAHCVCNGETVVDAMTVPHTGAISLVSDRGQVEFRRIRVDEAR